MGRREAKDRIFEKAAVIAAHPDDETIWAGGTILMHRQCRWTILVLTRASDSDRCGKFFKALEYLGASGKIADLDDSPQQELLAESQIEQEVLRLIGGMSFDVVITHSIRGEYTRHLRHEQLGRSVGRLWQSGAIEAGQMWMFAYEDGRRKYLPRAVRGADEVIELPEEIWRRKYDIITHVYGLGPESFESRAAPRLEAFWCFSSKESYQKWLEAEKNESSGAL